MNPKVLLLDEPLGALDLKVRKALQIELKRIQESVGITFVYVTHDQEEALAMSDRVAVMNDGQIEQLAPPQEVYDRPATDFVAEFIGDTNFVRTNGRRVAVRPERMRVATDGEGLAGTIVAAMTIGPALQIVVRLDDGQEVVARRPRDGSEGPPPAGGDRVVVSWAEKEALNLMGRERMSDHEQLLASVGERRIDRKGFVAGGPLLLAAAGLGRVPDAFGAGARRGGRALLLQLGRLREPEDVPRVHEGDRHDRQEGVLRLERGAPGEAQGRGSGATTSLRPPATWFQILAADDLLTPINWSKLPNVRRNIDPKFRKLPFDPQDRYSVAKDWGTTGFVYRTDKIKERPKSWEQFFALFEKYPRKFTLLDGSPEVIGSIAVMMGYSYNTDDAGQLNKVKDFLLPLKPNLLALDSVTYKQKIAGGKAFGGLGWNGDGATSSRRRRGRPSTSSPPRAASSGSTRT